MVIINPLLTWCSAGRFHVSISFSFMNLSHHPPRTPTGAPATTNTIRQRLNPKILHGGRRTISLLSRQHSPRWSRRVTEVAAASNHGGPFSTGTWPRFSTSPAFRPCGWLAALLSGRLFFGPTWTYSDRDRNVQATSAASTIPSCGCRRFSALSTSMHWSASPESWQFCANFFKLSHACDRPVLLQPYKSLMTVSARTRLPSTSGIRRKTHIPTQHIKNQILWTWRCWTKHSIAYLIASGLHLHHVFKARRCMKRHLKPQGRMWTHFSNV